VKASTALPEDSGVEHLRLLQVITDSTLAHLSVESLLDELLRRVQNLLQVDTAVVLLREPSGHFLHATAARGLEEEVRQGVRIPVGQGFAGRIAQHKRPVVLEHVDHSNVLNPLLLDKGITSMLGVPLIVAGRVLGVLHVGCLSERRFTEHETSLLQTVADRIALAVQTRASSAERDATKLMQRTLLPDGLPQIEGLEFASRYVPGEGSVGGDWYDVFSLPSGKICLVTGDVVSRGLTAALSMGQMRAVLRAYSLSTDDPAEMLSLLNDHVIHFQSETMATVLCAVLEPSLDQLQMSSAGHPPPVLAVPGQPSRLLEVAPDPPLGVTWPHPRTTTVMPLPPGSVLCLYTDGLVERRGELIDDGLELLRATVHPEPAETVCIKVMNRLVNTHIAQDDVAVLVLRRFPAED
jgi:hypothetical protein